MTTSLDHLVGACEQPQRRGDGKSLSGLGIDDQFELGRLEDRQIGLGFSPLRICATYNVAWR